MLDFRSGNGSWESPDDWGGDDAPHCASYLPGVPEEWARWPVVIDTVFTATPNSGVSQALFDEYEVRCMADAVRVVLDPRNDEILVGYTFRLREMKQPYRWFAVWPLARRGALAPETRGGGNWICPRSIDRGVFAYRPRPGEPQCSELERSTVLMIRNEPVNLYGTRTVRTLGVGGRTREAAVENWLRTARAIRAYRARLAAPPA